MSPEEAADAEALRRIREAENTGATSLDLSHLDFLYQLPKELERLKSLQTLDLFDCRQLSGDLSPLAGLTSLQSLDLSGCWQRTDFSHLAGLTSLQALQTLDLSCCEQLRRFAPLESLLPTLEWLQLCGCKFDDLPSEICGESSNENVLGKVRAHYEDLQAGP